MKYSAVFVLLSFFVCLAYSQETCERYFNQTQPCTPCQQVLQKHNVISTSESEPPKNKCFFLPSLAFHISETKKSITDTTPIDDKKKIIKESVSKTCDEAKECTESYAVAAYKEIDSACGAGILSNSSVQGSETAIMAFYTAIPFKGFLCSKEGDGKLSSQKNSLIYI